MCNEDSDKLNLNNRLQHNKPSYIVGIGASAGGLEAIESFFKNMPLTGKFAFVLVQHLSPNYKSLMSNLLARFTLMKILTAENEMIIEPDTIYLIPRKKNMTIYQDKLYLLEQEKGLNLPINIFFNSLALDRNKNAIGIILSGTGSDGSNGIKAIKNLGGIVFVQDESAKFNGMPSSAISTGCVDFILSPEQMPDELLKFIYDSNSGQNTIFRI